MSGAPPRMAGRDYLRPQTSWDPRGDQLQKLNRVDSKKSKEDVDAEFENSRASVKRFAESVLEAFDFSDEEEKVKREAFPDLFS